MLRGPVGEGAKRVTTFPGSAFGSGGISSCFFSSLISISGASSLRRASWTSSERRLTSATILSTSTLTWAGLERRSGSPPRTLPRTDFGLAFPP